MYADFLNILDTYYKYYKEIERIVLVNKLTLKFDSLIFFFFVVDL